MKASLLPRKTTPSLVEELLVIYLVEALGLTQDLHKSERVEILVDTFGDSLTLNQVKVEFKLTPEQEIAVGMILSPCLLVQDVELEGDKTVLLETRAA